MPRKTLRIVFAALLLSPIGGCGDGSDDGPIEVSVIGKPDQISAPLANLASDAGKVAFGATARGLVTYDNNGAVVPALAQRWIVVDDGKSYIFRLRRARWANGERVDARDVRQLLRKHIRAAVAQDPYGPLASVTEVLAMTADVIEIRLQSPQPDFLLALAQPEMGIAQPDGGSGPYRQAEANDDPGAILLAPAASMADPEARPADRSKRILRSERPAAAIIRFERGEADMMLGGRLADLPYISLAEVDRNSVRFDPVQGVFGLALSPKTPLFDDPNVREALAMAVERESIIAYFEMNRWKIANQIIPQQFDLPHPPTAPAWDRMTMEERRNRASGVITRWRAQHGGKPVTLGIALPEGPGMQLLFLALKMQFRAIGIEIEQVSEKADLILIDEIAPYDGASWYLGRLSCARQVHCSKEAEELLRSSLSAATMAERTEFLGQAEPLIQAHNGFIPLAAPVRWSLVRPQLDDYQPSQRNYHDLRWLEK